MLEFIDIAYEWFIYGLKGIGGLLAVTGGIAIVGCVLAFIIGVVSNAVFWPVFLSNRSKKSIENGA